MNQDFTPPPLNAIADALTVARLALNPEAAAKVLSEIKAATERHSEVYKAITGRSDALDAKEKDIARREAIVTAKEGALAARETELASAKAVLGARIDAHEQYEREFTASASALSVSLAAQKEELEHHRKAFEQTSSARERELKDRETAIAAREKAHAEKLARLKELAA